MDAINVAIADDNERILDLLGEIVSSDKELNLVGKTNNGEDMYRLIREKEPDVVLLDLIMPKMDGLSVIDMVNNDEVKSVTLQSDNLTIVPKKQVNPYQEISYYTNLTEDETALTKRLEGTGIIFKSEPPDAFGEFMAMMLSVLLPSVLLFVLLMFFMRRMNKGGGGMMGVGKSRA